MPSGEADAKHGLLGDAVEKRPECKACSGATTALARRGRVAARERTISGEVGQRPERKARGDRPPAAEPQPLLDELEANRADQRACAEGQDGAYQRL